MSHTTKKAQSTKIRIQKCAIQENRERPEQSRTRPDRNHERSSPRAKPTTRRWWPGSSTQGAATPWCGRTPGGRKPGPSFSRGCMPPCIGQFHLLPNLDVMNHPSSTIKREELPPFQHTHHLESIYLTPLTCIFSLD